ncbi:MAG: hypothetical protein Q4C97_02725 [Bacillota bacterium]|nr:hypothetical protein [Bacillota bacterium]
MKITPELLPEEFPGLDSRGGNLVGDAGFPPLKGTCIGVKARTL